MHKQATQRQLIWLIALCIMLQPMSTDFYLASLPFIGEAFAASTQEIQNTLSFFVVGFGSAQLIVGPLSDRYGRQPVLFAGLVLYIVASALCGLAGTMPVLVLGRLGQAVGCCTAFLIARAVIRDLYTLQEGARIMARASTLVALGPLLGPIAGGYLQSGFGWRAAFVAQLLFAALLLFGVRRLMGETLRARDPHAIRLSVMLASYRSILGTPIFWAYTLPGALSYASIFVFISGTSIILIRGLGVPAHYFGYCYALGVLGYLTGTMACQRLIARRGVEAAMTFGTRLAVCAGSLFLLFVGLGLVHWLVVVLAQCLVMFAHGITYPCSLTGSANPFPERAGAASGLSGFIAMMVALLAGIVIGATYDGTLYPMATMSALLGFGIFALAVLLRRFRRI